MAIYGQPFQVRMSRAAPTAEPLMIERPPADRSDVMRELEELRREVTELRKQVASRDSDNLKQELAALRREVMELNRSNFVANR